MLNSLLILVYTLPLGDIFRYGGMQCTSLRTTHSSTSHCTNSNMYESSSCLIKRPVSWIGYRGFCQAFSLYVAFISVFSNLLLPTFLSLFTSQLFVTRSLFLTVAYGTIFLVQRGLLLCLHLTGLVIVQPYDYAEPRRLAFLSFLIKSTECLGNHVLSFALQKHVVSCCRNKR